MEEKAKGKSATSTEFDKVRREISRQRMDLIREGLTLSFKEFQKLHNEQGIRFKPKPSQMMTIMIYQKRNLKNSLITLLL